MKRLLPFQRENHHPVMFVAMNIALLIAFFSFGLSTINAAISFPTITTQAKIQKQILLDVFTAVNTQRGAAGLSAKTFTALPSGYFQKIKMQNLQEARTAIEEIYTSKGVPLPIWTNPTLIAGQTPVRAIHFTELKAQLEEVLLHGVITTIAGTGVGGFSGDGGLATVAQFNYPNGITIDKDGNLYVSDYLNYRIRKITASTGVISTIAGTGVSGTSGDGGLAINAQLKNFQGIGVDQYGNVYVTNSTNSYIRKITASTGIITTMAGTWPTNISGIRTSATGEQIKVLPNLVDRLNGDRYLASWQYYTIVKRDARGNITRIAGNGTTAGFSGDNGLASAALIGTPYDLVVDRNGNMYLNDNGSRVRKITAVTGIITTIAGDGTVGFSGDGGSAKAAQFNNFRSMVIDEAGNNLYIADYYNHRIRKISL